VCWGEDPPQYGIFPLPPSVVSVAQLSSSIGNVCVLKTDGTVVCWRENTWGIADVPPGLNLNGDPPNAGWATLASMPSNNSGVSTAVAGGKLFVAGGNLPLFVYDPVTNTWSNKPPLPTDRSYTSAGTIDGKVYVAGGCAYGDCRIGVTTLMEAYDPTNNTWTSKAPMSTPRAGFVSGVIAGKLYVVGGFQACYGPCPMTNTLEVYDAASNTWTTKTPMPTTRSQMGGAVINGKLYVVGGTTSGGAAGAVTTLEVYDPGTNAWTTKAPMPTARYALGAGQLNGILYAISGNAAGEVTVNTVEAYNPATDTWSTVAPIPTARYGGQPQDYNGVLYVAANGPGNQAVASLEAYGVNLNPPAPQVISFTSSPPSPALTGGTYSVAAIGGASGNAVVFSSLSTSICTVGGNSVSLLTVGDCIVAANQAGGSGYSPAPQISQTFVVRQNPCVTVLDNSSSKALHVYSKGHLTISSCRIAVNSSASDALRVESDGVIDGANLIVVRGGYNASGGSVSPIPQSTAVAVADPLAYLAIPAAPACNGNYGTLNISSSQTLSPGSYCGGIKIANPGTTVRFNPGIYFLQGGGLDIEQSAVVTGSGVTFVNMNAPAGTAGGAANNFKIFNFQSGGSASLSAPTTGPLAGVLFYQDPSAGVAGHAYLNTFQSGSSSIFGGSMYFPTQSVMFKTSGAILINGGIVADIVGVQGTGHVTVNGGGGG